MAKKPVVAKVQKYIAESHDGAGFIEAEFNPLENAFIFRDHHKNEIWLDPESLRVLIGQLGEFTELLEHMGVKTKGA